MLVSLAATANVRRITLCHRFSDDGEDEEDGQRDKCVEEQVRELQQSSDRHDGGGRRRSSGGPPSSSCASSTVLLLLFQRTEKGREYDLFVLKIQKLEKLCRALQEERVVLYEKIKEVRKASGASQVPFPSSNAEIQELQEIQEQDPVLTNNMSRLREEQAKLQELAASLFATPLEEDKQEDEEEPKLDVEEDQVSSAFSQFRTRTQVLAESDSFPEQAGSLPGEIKGHSHGDESAAAAQEPPVESEPAPDPAELQPEVSSETSVPDSVPACGLDDEEQRHEEEAIVAPPSDASPTASSDSSKKQTSKKKKKKNTKNAS